MINPEYDRKDKVSKPVRDKRSILDTLQELIDEEEDVIEQHISCSAQTVKYARLERQLLTDATDQKHDTKHYLCESIKLLEMKIALWTELKARMAELNGKLD
jgi:hypothetical protein